MQSQTSQARRVDARTDNFGKVAVLRGGRARHGAAERPVREGEADTERRSRSSENDGNTDR
jgi:hypothetical protein